MSALGRKPPIKLTRSKFFFMAIFELIYSVKVMLVNETFNQKWKKSIIKLAIVGE